jgi:hypothetical protein
MLESIVVSTWATVVLAETEEERELAGATMEELEKYVVFVFDVKDSIVLVFVEADIGALEFIL